MELSGISEWIWAWIVLSCPIGFLGGLICGSNRYQEDDGMESIKDAFKEEA